MRQLTVAQLRNVRRFGPGRAMPPTVGFLGRRSAGLRQQQAMARGGFFKKLFKGVKKIVKVVSKVPVVGTIAKAAVGSLPVVGQVVTAVNVLKRKTAVGAAASPVGGVTPSQQINVATNRPPRARRRKTKTAPRRSRPARKARKGGGTAKQRAARARFAAAARKGRIRKGARL